jgi:hypothetical protein
VTTMPIAAPCPVCGQLTVEATAIVAGGEMVPIFPGVPVEDAYIQGAARLMRFDLPCGHSAGGYDVRFDLGAAVWRAVEEMP